MDNYSEWFTVYMDFDETGAFYCLRFTPIFMDLEYAGHPHGLSFCSEKFASKEGAMIKARQLDKFFNLMRKEILND